MADPGIYFGGGQTKFSDRKLMAKPESRARSARVEGAKRLRFEGKARTEGEAREKTGERVWGGGSVSPSPEIFLKIKLEIIQFGAYLRQTFQINNNMHGSRSSVTHIHEKILILNILCMEFV